MQQWMQRVRVVWSQLAAAQVLFAAFLCLVMGFAAQHSLDRHTTQTVALLTFAAATLIFALLTHDVASEATRSTADSQRPSAASWFVLGMTLALSLLGCLDFAGNEFRPLGLVLWLGGLLFTFLYLWLISPREAGNQRFHTWQQSKKLPIPWHWLLLLAILVWGAWLRLRLLSEIPADMGWDLPYNYYDVLAILRGKLLIFFPANLGREGLFFYLCALVARIVSLSQWSLQLTSALLGTVTIIALYALGREAFNHQVGLLAALLLAINRWHIVLSRPGYRVILLPLFTILALYTLIRALRRRRLLDWAWAGLALGLGFYTYKSFLFVPVAVVIGLLLYWIAHGWSEMRSILPGLLLFGLVTLVVVAPLGRYVLEKPAEYLAREQRQFEVMSRQPQRPSFLTYYWRSLLGFNVIGDGNIRFNVPLARHMGFVSGVLMVLGLGYMLLRWRHGYNGFLLAALFVLVVPTAATMLPNEPPNIFRMSGTIGPALILAALPWYVIQQRIQQTNRQREAASHQATWAAKWPKVSLMVSSPTRHYAWHWQARWMNIPMLILILAGAWLLLRENAETNRFYFHDYMAVLPDNANYSVAREMAREIAHFGDLSSAYVKVWPHWFDGNSLRVNLRLTDPTINVELQAVTADQPPLSTIQGPALFLLHPDDSAALETLRNVFPRSVLIPRYYPNGNVSFYAFYAER